MRKRALQAGTHVLLKKEPFDQEQKRMKILRLPFHGSRYPGCLLLALLVGVMLALFQLLPVLALTSPTSAARFFSADPNYVLDKAGPSVVRLIVTYANSTSLSPRESETCTGLGTLVRSVPGQAKGTYQVWVLTDASLLNMITSTCKMAGADTEDIQVLASSTYAQAPYMLGRVSCNIVNSIFPLCQGGNFPPSGGLSPAQFMLFSFQTNVDQPYLLPARGAISTPNAIGLTNAGHQLPPPKVALSIVPTLQSYLIPTFVSPSAANPPGVPSSPTSTSGSTSGIEPGTPQVDASGNLTGMYVDGGRVLNLSLIEDGLNSVGLPFTSAPNPGSVAALWDNGIDALNQGTPTSCQTAHADFLKIPALNPAFKVATVFAGQAQVCAHSAPTLPFTSNSSALSLLILLVLGLIVLLLVLVLVTVLLGRVHKRRREREKFASEWEESQQQARAVMEQQRVQTLEMPCPNCHQPVHVNDVMCRNCRYPLSPSASGLHMRLAGPGPLPATGPLLPPASRGAQVAGSAAIIQPPGNIPAISDLPTMQFAPPPPAPAPGAQARSDEITARRKKSPQGDETLYVPPGASGRNLTMVVSTRTDPGLKRKHKPNEDSLFAMQGTRAHNSQPQQFGLFVVADGMGGHAKGQDASRQAIQTMIDYMLPRLFNSAPADDEAFKRLLGDGVQNANLAVHNRNLEAHADMGTTMTTALVVGTTAYVANVGDSRTYLYRREQGLSKVTTDHSVVASLVEAGIIQPDDIYTHPKRSHIYRSLGEKPVVEVDTFQVEMQPGDKLLLCSDGLWDMVRDPAIQQIIAKRTTDPNKTSQELIKAALQGGGEDNVTVIVAQFAEQSAGTGTTGVQILAQPETVTVPTLPTLS